MKKILLLLTALFVMGGVEMSAENRYLEITTNAVKENPWEWAVWYQLDTPLEAGKTYVLTMDAKCSEAYQMSFWPTNTEEGGQTTYTGYSIGTEWTACTCEFTPNDALNRLSWNFGSLNGTLRFDNIKLVEKGKTENLINDGAFDGALPSNWGNDGWNSPQYSIKETESVPVGRCLKITTNSVKENAWEWAIWYKLDTPLEEGETYVLTMKAKCSEAYQMSFWPNGGGVTLYTGYSITTEWSDCSCTFKANGALDRLTWNFGSLQGELCFDDIRLVKQGESDNLINDGSFDGTLVSNWGNDGWNKPEYAIVIDYPAVVATKPQAEVLLEKSMFKGWTGPEPDATISTNSPFWDAVEDFENVGAGAVVFGNSSVGYKEYADLSKYSGMKIYGTGDNLRILMNRESDGGPLTEVRVTPTESGTFLDFSSYEFVHLNAIKVINEANSTNITKITLVDPSVKQEVDYVFTGDMKEGVMTASATAALADASAKVIDVTGMLGTGLTLTPANPNAIFLAKEGTLSNTKNVQIGNTIAKLEITDKKPLADLTGVTATAATYTRSMTNKFGTICLPYAVTSTESVKYYTIDNLDGDVLTLKEETELAAGTPAIVEKVSGESITATGSGALAAAGAPTDNLELIGTFEEKTVLAEDYAGKNIYAIKNNQFVQGLNSITVPAFRAYFTADASAEANLRLAFGDEATAIDSLTGEKSIKAIYSVSGASQASLQKGMNIVEFTDGSVKKVMVK